MGDYFKKWVAQLEKNRSTEFWLPLATLEEVRVFPQNPMAENLATSIRALENEIYELDRQENVSGIDQLRKSQEVYLEDYISAFKADEGRMGANLEKVLTMLDTMQGFDAEDAWGRLLMSIGTFFRELDQIVGKGEWPHHNLARLLKNRQDIAATFVSFNYDLWLETSLQRQGVWHPATGYGHRFSRISRIQALLKRVLGGTTKSSRLQIRLHRKHWFLNRTDPFPGSRVAMFKRSC